VKLLDRHRITAQIPKSNQRTLLSFAVVRGSVRLACWRGYRRGPRIAVTRVHIESNRSHRIREFVFVHTRANIKMFLTVGFHRWPVWARPIQRGLFSGFCNPIRGYGSAKSEGFPTGTTGFVYTYFLLFPLRYQCWSIRQIPVSIPPRPTKVIDRSNFLSFIQVPTRRSRSLPPLTRRLLLREIFSSATKSMRPTARPELFW
jgi:hypothetical protein